MNEHDQAQVAYEDKPKEVNSKRRMPQGDKQFGKVEKTMPQDVQVKKVSKKPARLDHGRHKEHR